MFGAQRVTMNSPWQHGTILGRRLGQEEGEACVGGICPAPETIPPEFQTPPGPTFPPTTTTEDAQPGYYESDAFRRITALADQAYAVNPECVERINKVPFNVPDSEVIPMYEECIRSAGRTPITAAQGGPIQNAAAPSEFPILPVVAVGAGALILFLAL